MARWFLSTRAQSVGGPAAPVKVIDADRMGHTGDLTDELIASIRGRDVVCATHGFEVNQADGITRLTLWFELLQCGGALPIGILWPGDSVVPVFVDYILEGREAINSGNLLAAFLNAHFAGVGSMAFASHSLGARVVLQTIARLQPSIHVRRALLMAGAIEDNCLVGEYQAAGARIDQISILASTRDDVLALAFPLGDPLQTIIDGTHPYYRAALGRNGPATPYPPAPHLRANWQIPSDFDYGHHSYLPQQASSVTFLLPVDLPAPNEPYPPAGTQPPTAPPEQWQPAWSAAFASSRFR